MRSTLTTSGIVAFAAMLVFAAACQDSTGPTSPENDTPPAFLTIAEWQFGANETTARVHATWVGGAGPIDVTSRAQWTSDEPAVLEVAGPGVLRASASGDAELTVSFRGVTRTQYFLVFAGEPPWPAHRSGDSAMFSGSVREAGVTGTAAGIGGARVEIIGGHNAGREAVTDAAGFYTLLPPLVCGPITARATKTGYDDATASSVMCVDGMPPLVMTRR